MTKEWINRLLLYVAFILSVCVYIFQNTTAVYLIILCISLISFCLLNKIIVNDIIILSIIYLVFTTISVLVNSAYTFTGTIQNWLYPLIIIIYYNIFNSIINEDFLRTLTKYLILFSVSNFLLAITNSFAGPLSVPFIGTLEHSRTIFFTSVPSSSGLIWNVNYYSIVQAIIFWLSVRFYNPVNNIKKKAVLIILFLSVLWGSSRGLTFSFLISISVYTYFASPKISLSIVFSVIVFTLLSIDTIINEYSESLRVYKGLNNRAYIWGAAVELIKEKPFWGHSDINMIAKTVVDLGSPTTSIQNTYLLSVLRVGILGTLAWLSIIIRSITKNWDVLKNERWCISILLIWLLDSFVRSYNLGGVGFVPLVILLIIFFINKR